MTAAIEMQEGDAAIVLDILGRFLPRGAHAFVFGSRAHGGARQYSDLDLAIEWDRPLGLDLTARIAEAFSESDLPYKVDIVELSTIEPGFRARIARNMVRLSLDREAR
ncbi:MAG: nucleotidyltransferase domain-containing protein [Acetobacteraceae bacterium]